MSAPHLQGVQPQVLHISISPPFTNTPSPVGFLEILTVCYMIDSLKFVFLVTSCLPLHLLLPGFVIGKVPPGVTLKRLKLLTESIRSSRFHL